MNIKMIYIVVSILFIWLVLDQLTLVNVRITNFLQQQSEDKLPFLTQKIESKTYTIETVLLGEYGSIYYEPSKKYYVASTSEGVAKINHQGVVTFKILASEGHQIQHDVEGAHFVLTSKGIINLHDEKPIIQPYTEVRHLSDSTHSAEWEILFRSNYERATYVIFDRYYTAVDSTVSEEAIHFYIADKWTTLIQNENAGTIYATEQAKNYYSFFDDTPELEPKSNPLYIMKDVKKRTYSNANRTTDAQLSQNYEADFPHKGFSYTAQTSLKVSKFKKLEKYNYPETIWFLLPLSWLPQEYVGEAVNSLKVKGEELCFKTKATRDGLGIGTVDNHTYVFDVPSQFNDTESLSFIWTSENRNSTTWHNEGFYVIKKKQ